MAKRDTVTSSCLDLGLEAIMTTQQSGESQQDIQTELTFIKKNTFAQLAEDGNWAELVAATEKVLSSAGASSDARMWWIRAHLKGRTLPVSLLLPPFASLCRHSVQRNEMSTLKSELSELASAMINHMQSSGEREGRSELNELIKRHDLFTDGMEKMLEDVGEALSTDEPEEQMETQRSLGIVKRNVETSRLSKTAILIILLFLGSGSVFMAYRDFTSVAQMNTVAVIDRVVEQTAPVSEISLPNFLKRVELSNLEALRYGIREDTALSLTPVSETTGSTSVPRGSNTSAVVDQKASLDSAKRTIKKETINIYGPVEGSEFSEGKDREKVIRPQLPRPKVFDRPIDGGVMHAPFDTRYMVVVSSSRVFKRATTSSAVLGQLLSGDKIVVEGVYGKWARIRSRTGRIGFVPIEALGEGLDFRAP